MATYRGGKKRNDLTRRTGLKNVIALRLVEARLKQTPPWSQERLCTELELRTQLVVDQPTIGKIETQTRGVYDFEIVAFALTLGVTCDWLLGFEEEGSKHLEIA